VEFNYAANKDTGVFAIALRKDVGSPFPVESDEVTITKEGAKEGPKEGEQKKPEEAKPSANMADMTIDFDGIESRACRAPIEPNNYAGLAAKGGYLFYAVAPAFYYGRQGEAPPSLRVYSIKDRKETMLAEGISGYALSADGSKLLVRQGPGFTLMDANPQGDKAKKTVSTANLFVDRVPAEEWARIFGEVWRRYRDFFYVSNVHGYDVEAVRKQYEPLLKYGAHRSDLNYVISEMISELSVQHAYIEGGDFNIPQRPRVALPGARFGLNREAGRYQITKIFAGQNEEEIYRSPLTEVGVDVKVGDYVLAINGAGLRPDDEPYRMLRNQADAPVQLTVNSRPTMEGARVVSYRPPTTDHNLLYLASLTATTTMLDS